MAEERPRHELYTLRDHPACEALHATRTAVLDAAFFLPHLRPAMRVLDVGCGPGAITVGLAEVVHPGEAVGVDFQATQIDQARALEAERGAANARSLLLAGDAPAGTAAGPAHSGPAAQRGRPDRGPPLPEAAS